MKALHYQEDVAEVDVVKTSPFGDWINNPQQIDGLALMKQLAGESVPCAFFDPQYRGVLDRQHYGNEGKGREARRCALSQMREKQIILFLQEINRILKPSGHLFLWVDKFHLCEGTKAWLTDTKLHTVDLVVWEKPRIGMGYRTRNKAEFLLVVQKKPIKAKGVWRAKNIPNVIKEDADKSMHPHGKPVGLQRRLIEAVTTEGDLVLDPAMGGGSVFVACRQSGRGFVGGDLNEPPQAN